MKNLFLMFPLFISVILAGCNSTEGGNTEENSSSNSGNSSQEDDVSSENLFDNSDIEEGFWIGQSGVKVEDEDMVLSNRIEYNPEKSYTMNKTAYVTYLSGDEILNTVLHDGSVPIEIMENEQADSIRISFDKSKLEELELVEQ